MNGTRENNFFSTDRSSHVLSEGYHLLIGMYLISKRKIYENEFRKFSSEILAHASSSGK